MKKNTSRKIFAATASAALVATAVVPAAFAEETKQAFPDVPADHNYSNVLNDLYDAGVVKGYEDGTFDLGGTLTRAEASVMVASILDLDTENAPKTAFEDVKDGAWYEGSINALHEAGHIAGLDDGTFAPDKKLTRAELVQLVYVAYGIEAVEAELPFEDLAEAEDAWYKEPLKALYANGLIAGVDTASTKFAPSDEIKRGDFAWLLANADYKFGDKLPKPVTEEDVAVESVSAINGTLTVELAEAAEEVSVGNFTVTQAINGGTEREVTPSEAVLSEDGKTVELTVAEVAQKEILQSVVYTVNEVAAEAFNVAGTVTEVETIEVLNAAQIKIVFSQQMDESSVEDLDNYYIGLTKDVDSSFITDLGNTGYTAELQNDKRTVIISADDLTTHAIWADEYTGAQAIKTSAAETVLENRTVYVQVKDVKTATGNLIDALETSFVAKDSEGPKFASDSYSVSEVTSNPTLVFSEPVVFDLDESGGISTGDAQFYLNGTNVTAAVDYLDPAVSTANGYSKITVDLTALAAGFELEEGDNTFEVVGLEDLAGNSTTPSRITTTIKVAAEAAVAPKVAYIEQFHDGAFLVAFDKNIANAGTVTVKNNVNDGTDLIANLNGAAGTNGAFHSRDNDGNYRYLVEFDVDSDYTSDEVYQEANSVIRTVIVEDFQDTSATKTGTKHSKAYTFKKDNIAPTVVSAKVVDDAANSDQDILLTFTDAPFNGDTLINADLSTVDNLILKVVEDGVTATVAVPAASVSAHATIKNAYVVALDASEDTALPQYGAEQDLFDNNGNLRAGITVTLPYGLVTDDAGDDTPQYSGPYSFIGATLDVQGGSSAVVPQTSQAGISYNADLNAIDVEFVGEDIDATTVTNKANYVFDGRLVSNITGASIEYSTTGGTKLARIFLPDNSVLRDGNYDLTISNVATKSGAKMLPTTVSVYNVEDNTQPLATAAKVTSDNTIEVTFDETLDVTAGNPVVNAQRNFKVIVGGATYNVSAVEAKNARTLVLTTVDTFDYSKAVQVRFAPDASNDVFVKDLAGNEAAAKTVTATKDVE